MENPVAVLVYVSKMANSYFIMTGLGRKSPGWAGSASRPPDSQDANFAVFVTGLAVISQKLGDVHKSRGERLLAF